MSFVCVPRPDRALSTADEPALSAAVIFASSSFDPDHAHSPSVKRSNVVPPMSSVTVDPPGSVGDPTRGLPNDVAVVGVRGRRWVRERAAGRLPARCWSGSPAVCG